MEPNRLNLEATGLVLLHLVDVDTVSTSVDSEIGLTLLNLTLGKGMNAQVVTLGLPVQVMELENVSIDENLSMRHRLNVLVVKIIDLDSPLMRLLLAVLVNNTEVSTGWVHDHPQLLRVLDQLLVHKTTVRNLHEANLGVNFWRILTLLLEESRVDDVVLIRDPEPLPNSLDSNGLLLSIAIRKQLHTWQLVDRDTLLDLCDHIVNSSLIPEFLSKVLAIVRPLVCVFVFLGLSIKISNDLNHLEVPHCVGFVTHWRVAKYVFLIWGHDHTMHFVLRKNDDRNHFLTAEEGDLIRLDHDQERTLW